MSPSAIQRPASTLGEPTLRRIGPVQLAAKVGAAPAQLHSDLRPRPARQVSQPSATDRRPNMHPQGDHATVVCLELIHGVDVVSAGPDDRGRGTSEKCAVSPEPRAYPVSEVSPYEPLIL